MWGFDVNEIVGRLQLLALVKEYARDTDRDYAWDYGAISREALQAG